MIGMQIALSVALLAPTAPVQAGPSLGDVRLAVLRQYAKNTGVRFSTRERQGGSLWGVERIAGALRFTRSGVARSDITHMDDEGGLHVITIGRTSYRQVLSASGKPVSARWELFPDAVGFRYDDDLISAANPAFLDVVERHASTGVPGGVVEGVATTLYEGGLDMPELGTTLIGDRFGLDSWAPGVTAGRVTWKLWAGPDNLPRRFTASIVWDMSGSETPNISTSTTTFYKRWGDRVEIKAPPKKMVIA